MDLCTWADFFGSFCVIILYVFAPKTILDRFGIHNLEGVKYYKIQSKSFHKRQGLSYIILNIIVSDWMLSRNEFPRNLKFICHLFYKNPSLLLTLNWTKGTADPRSS